MRLKCLPGRLRLYRRGHRAERVGALVIARRATAPEAIGCGQRRAHRFLFVELVQLMYRLLVGLKTNGEILSAPTARSCRVKRPRRKRFCWDLLLQTAENGP